MAASSRTKVVNVKVGEIRPRYANLKEWMKAKNHVYIGRAGVVFIDKERFPKKASPFANKFKIGKSSTREDVIAQFREWFYDKIAKDKDFKAQVEKLRGKTLGCWCKPEACHGDVIVEYLEGRKVKTTKSQPDSKFCTEEDLDELLRELDLEEP